MILYYKDCKDCGKPNRFRACNNYTPVRMRKKCMRCSRDMILDIEKTVAVNWCDMDYEMENKIIAKVASRGRRVGEYRRRTQNEYMS